MFVLNSEEFFAGPSYTLGNSGSPRYKRVKDFLLAGDIAQLVEQRPFKAWVEGSSPSILTI